MVYGRWPKYVPVAQRRAKTAKKMAALRKKGQNISPIQIEGRTIARSFWGKAWCAHLEKFSDYENRLPRGRTYVRNGSVCHLEIGKGRIEAKVSGSSLYCIHITIDPLPKKQWDAIKKRSAGSIGSMVELLQGRLSDSVMRSVTDQDAGLFPRPSEIKLACSCPDWADLCKHLAAVLYGVGARLDEDPALLFLLRGVDQRDLIANDLDLGADDSDSDVSGDLANIFGIDLDDSIEPVETVRSSGRKVRAKARSKGGSKKIASKVLSKKVASKKAVSKKTASRKTASKKAASKKAASKKTASKKTASKKAASKKAASKKAASKKAASKKAASKKAASKKTASKKCAS